MSGFVLAVFLIYGPRFIQARMAARDRLSAETREAAARAEFNINAAEPGRAGTCFGNQLPPDPRSELIEKASVLLEAVNADDQKITGTGTVVRGSADRNGNQMILTAYHVARDAGTAEFRVTDSAGMFLGTAYPVAWAAARPGEGPNGYDGGDIAVLGMVALSRGGSFGAITGLEIGLSQAPGMLSGPVTIPGGVLNGASGAALVGGDGRIAGVLVVGSEPRDDAGLQVIAGRPVAMTWSEGRPATGTINLPSRSTGFAETVSDPLVLKSLGAAGASTTVSGSTETFQPTDMVIAAYPYGSCIAYRGKFSGMPAAERERTGR